MFWVLQYLQVLRFNGPISTGISAEIFTGDSKQGSESTDSGNNIILTLKLGEYQGSDSAFILGSRDLFRTCLIKWLLALPMKKENEKPRFPHKSHKSLMQRGSYRICQGCGWPPPPISSFFSRSSQT